MAKANPAARRRATSAATITATATATKAPRQSRDRLLSTVAAPTAEAALPRPRVETAPGAAFALLPRPGERVEGFSRPWFYRKTAEGVPLLRRVGGRTLIDLAALRAFITAAPLVEAGSAPPRGARRAAKSAAT